MTKTVIPGYNGFVEWAPEEVYASSMVGFLDESASPKKPVWDGAAMKVLGEVTTSPNGALWIGPVSSFKISDNVVPSSLKYLKADKELQRSISVLHSKAIEEVSVDLEMVFQPRFESDGAVPPVLTATNLVWNSVNKCNSAFGLFLMCIGDGNMPESAPGVIDRTKTFNAVGQLIDDVTLGVFCLGDNLGSVGFSAGIMNSGTTTVGLATNYMCFWGGKCKEATLSIAEDENVKLTSSFACGGVIGPTEDYDYISTGTVVGEVKTVTTDRHVVQPNPMLDPISYESVQNFKYRARAPCDSGFPNATAGTDGWLDFDPVRSIEISISNDLKLIKDIGAPDCLKSTRIVNAVIMNRELTVTLEVDYNGFALFEKVRDFNEFQVCFDIIYASCSTYEKAARFYITGIKFTEMPLELNPEDIIGDSITSLPVTGFSIEDLDYDTPAERPHTHAP